MSPEGLALSIVILLFSIIVHEVMHGFVALRYGDDTAEKAGRLTLNPLPHIDLVGTILLPLLCIISQTGILFGWAKPVPVNPLKFKKIREGEIAVSLAGILSNFALALVAIILYHLAALFFPTPLIFEALFFMVYINLLLGIFNLIPIPPLDGSKVVMALLPYNEARSFQQIERYGIFILFALIIIPIGGNTLIGYLVDIVGSLTRILLG